MTFVRKVLLLLVVNCISVYNYLVRPNIRGLRTFDNGFHIAWSPVPSFDKNYPVVGYKVNIWESESGPINTFNVDETRGLNETFRMLGNGAVTLNVPNRLPNMIIIETSNAANISHIKKGLMYEVRVQAYSDMHTGPHSYPVGFIIS